MISKAFTALKKNKIKGFHIYSGPILKPYKVTRANTIFKVVKYDLCLPSKQKASGID
jgi:hypothetical protein